MQHYAALFRIRARSSCRRIKALRAPLQNAGVQPACAGLHASHPADEESSAEETRDMHVVHARARHSELATAVSYPRQLHDLYDDCIIDAVRRPASMTGIRGIFITRACVVRRAGRRKLSAAGVGAWDKPGLAAWTGRRSGRRCAAGPRRGSPASRHVDLLGRLRPPRLRLARLQLVEMRVPLLRRD